MSKHIRVSELPPRARRIRASCSRPTRRLGTTSACAENTLAGMVTVTRDGNYLRVRGEYGIPESFHRASWELPPRARRILQHHMQRHLRPGTTSACAENTRHGTPRLERRIPFWDSISHSAKGTTSACAENTHQQSAGQSRQWNYLRVRGEYRGKNGLTCVLTELPPRARRIRTGPPICRGPCGTTSACAENTEPAYPNA